MRFKILGVLLAALLIIVLLGVELLNRPTAVNVRVVGGKAVVGQLAPGFSTETIDGASVSLSQFRGKPVLLNFWATWCPPCHDEMPLLQQASNADRAQGLTVLAVDYEETNGGSIRSFLDKLGVHVAALYDPAGQIAAEYGVNVGLPVSVFIDRSGKVSYIQVGQMSNQVLQQHLQPIL